MMNDILIEDSTFEGENFSQVILPKSEYESCRFVKCNFASSDVSHIRFINCEFVFCDFSNANVSHTTLNDVIFRNCKLLGVKFADCNSLIISMGFEDCRLDMSSFYRLKLKGIIFKRCQLQDVDFTEADLTSAVFDDCDLSNALFENSVLKGADLRTASNYSIDPETNRIEKAKFSVFGLVGLLEKYNIRVE